MVDPRQLKKLSTTLLTFFFIQAPLRCMWHIQEHSSFVAAATSSNKTLVKIFMVFLSMTELLATAALSFPLLSESRNGQRVACACLMTASFCELLMHTLASDNNSVVTSAFLFATCALRLLETLSSRDLRVHQGNIGQERSHFDRLLGKVRDMAARYSAASTTTVCIFTLLVYTLATTESTTLLLWRRTTSLKRQLAINVWSKTASLVSLLATIGASDTTSTRSGKKKSL